MLKILTLFTNTGMSCCAFKYEKNKVYCLRSGVIEKFDVMLELWVQLKRLLFVMVGT